MIQATYSVGEKVHKKHKQQLKEHSNFCNL